MSCFALRVSNSHIKSLKKKKINVAKVANRGGRDPEWRSNQSAKEVLDVCLGGKNSILSLNFFPLGNKNVNLVTGAS